MLKRITVFLALALGAVGVAQAEQTMAYVNMQQLVAQSPQGKQARQDLQKELKAKQKEIKALQQEYQSLQDKLERDGLTMSESEREDLEQKLLKKQREVRWKQQTYKEDLKISQNDVMRDVQEEIFKAVRSLAQSRDIDLVVRQQGLIYASDRVNLTGAVLEELKKAAK